MQMTLKPAVREQLKTNPQLIAHLAVLNGVSIATVQDMVQRNKPSLAHSRYLWPIAKWFKLDCQSFTTVIETLTEGHEIELETEANSNVYEKL